MRSFSLNKDLKTCIFTFLPLPCQLLSCHSWIQASKRSCCCNYPPCHRLWAASSVTQILHSCCQRMLATRLSITQYRHHTQTHIHTYAQPCSHTHTRWCQYFLTTAIILCTVFFFYKPCICLTHWLLLKNENKATWMCREYG